MKLYIIIIDCNDRNGATFFNEKIINAIRRVMVEEEAEANNVTVDNFSQILVTANT